MKKINVLPVLVLFMALLGFNSCDNESLDPAIVVGGEVNPNPNPTGGILQVDFDNQTYVSSTTQVYISAGTIQVLATNSQGTVGFIVSGTTVGTYNGDDILFGYTPTGADNSYTNVGSTAPAVLTITAINTTNKTISGTFNFTGGLGLDAAESKVFTNGVFTNLPYISENPTGDTFFAKVDGTEFVDDDIFVVVSEVNGASQISIQAINADDTTLAVNLDQNITVGTYTITGTNVATDKARGRYEVGDTTNFANSGTVTITEKTALRVKGTFSFNVGPFSGGTTTHTVTEGTFDVQYGE